MPGTARSRVWVDTDVALGAPRGDVDDGFALAALLAAHRRGDVELVGVSTVFGNTSAALSKECAAELARQAGCNPPVVAGAERPGEDSPAARAIADLPADTRLLCLGPLTNAARACRRNSHLAPRIDLSAVGGNISSRGFLAPVWPFEFNLARDAESARSVLAARWKSLALFPLDVVRRLDAGDAELTALSRLGALGHALSRGSRRWLARAHWRHPLGRRFPVWDLPAALDAVGLLEGRFAERRPARGAERYLGRGREFRFLVSFDAPRAWSSFAGLLGAESAEPV